MSKTKTAVVLFNLGGPDRADNVRPFLFNLFNDPAILRVPNPLRLVLAHLIARRRSREAARIYDRIGGASPLLPNTQAQARALEQTLQRQGEVRVFVAMRYWHPMSDEVAYQVQDFDPDRIVLLPLYPQWSTTTSASSLRAWRRSAGAIGLDKPTRTICCYPDEPGFIAAMTASIRCGLEEAAGHGRPRILFSAHGLPKKVVRGGDPYQWQCERTARALVSSLAVPDLDWVTCYQSRVGPLEWIGPSTDAEIERAGTDGVPVLVVPIAFVSEHSETLVEVEIEYRHLAAEKGVPYFARIPAVGDDEAFITGLAALVDRALAAEGSFCSAAGGRICPAGFAGCPQRSADAVTAIV